MYKVHMIFNWGSVEWIRSFSSSHRWFEEDIVMTSPTVVGGAPCDFSGATVTISVPTM